MSTKGNLAVLEDEISCVKDTMVRSDLAPSTKLAPAV